MRYKDKHFLQDKQVHISAMYQKYKKSHSYQY